MSIDYLFKTMSDMRNSGYACEVTITKNGMTIKASFPAQCENIDWEVDSDAEEIELVEEEPDTEEDEDVRDKTLEDIIIKEFGWYDPTPCPGVDDLDEVERPEWWNRMSDSDKKSYLDWELDNMFK